MLNSFKDIEQSNDELSVSHKEKGEWTERAARQLLDEIHVYYDQPDTLFIGSFITLKKKLHHDVLRYLCEKFAFFKREYKLIKQIQEQKLINAVVDGKIDKSFAQFLMKNWFNYQDRIDQTVTNITPPTINVHSEAFKLKYNQPKEQEKAA